MYEIRYWHEAYEFEYQSGDSRHFTTETSANNAAIEISKNGGIFAVVEDGQTKPYSIFVRGRQYKIVEVDDLEQAAAALDGEKAG